MTTDCIPWHLRLDKGGYGRIVKHGKTLSAHRHIYEECFGPIPAGLQIDHLCRNRACVNPAHMELVTLAENVRRGAQARTHCPHGHPYTEANTYFNPKGRRCCRMCNRRRWKEWDERQKRTTSFGTAYLPETGGENGHLSD